jgi:hypothetical protein
MSPETNFTTPFGASATTWGRSNTVHSTWRKFSAISCAIAPLPPPTSTTDSYFFENIIIIFYNSIFEQETAASHSIIKHLVKKDEGTGNELSEFFNGSP